MKAAFFEEFGGALTVSQVDDPAVDDDGVIIKEPCVLFAVSGSLDTSAGSVGILYNAQSAKTGREVINLKAAVNVHRQIHFGVKGILCDGGLYVDMGTNGVEFLVVFDPVSALDQLT